VQNIYSCFRAVVVHGPGSDGCAALHRSQMQGGSFKVGSGSFPSTPGAAMLPTISTSASLTS
jgi:hypothetical protein